jgi:trehalose-6-phosphate synthase/HAMP domain-containing protein
MKRFFIFILPILIMISVAFTVFGIFQVRFEQEKLLDDLQRKTKAIAESMDLAVKQVLLKNDKKNANYIVQKFEVRERLQGCVIYDKNQSIFAITNRVQDLQSQNKDYIVSVFANKQPYNAMQKFKEYSVYTYVMPVFDDNKNILGAIEIIHDTSYVFIRLIQIWRRINITLIALVIMILIISLLIQRKIFVIPLQQLTEWFKLFQKGETIQKHPIKVKDELGKLANEVEEIALSLRVARRSMVGQAEKRLKKEEVWTETKLRDLIHTKIGENAFFVVSNREPYMHVINEKTDVIDCIRPASGVVTAINPILCATGGTWIAHGSGNADRKFVNSKNKLGVPTSDIRYILKRVWISKEEEEGYYYGFSNEGLWPLCHNTHTRPMFREIDWKMYKQVNQKFAQAVIEELPAQNPFIFIQDYHFTLLPKMIKDIRPDAIIALFWHIPWPTAESFAICPYYSEILDGMLGCDLIGFHVQNHCNNFLDTANKLLESRVDTEKFSIVRNGKETFVRAIPISIDTNATQKSLTHDIEKIKKEFKFQNKIVALGVDRIDYTKGISERILAIDRFLEKYQQYKNKFVFVQIAAPSRTHIKIYHDLMSEIDEMVEKINWKYTDGDWQPIIYLKKHFSPEEIEPFYKIADLCIVSSLHDGMNLVAKEYISAKKDDGMLILSQFTGASRELTDAVLINPYSIEEFAESIKIAIEMPIEEKKKKMKNMYDIVSENNVYKWAASIISELAATKKAT